VERASIIAQREVQTPLEGYPVLEVHAYIDVADVERAIAFYCDGLGLTVKRRLDRHWIELAGTAIPIFLLSNRPRVADLGSVKESRRYDRHWTPVHLDFIVSDLDAMVLRVRERGGSLDRAIESKDYGRIAYMADPFGNGFDLIEFSGSGYDAVQRI
jgi:predicted enzyme related to lactoylglutathione lyase